jgi:hypothetical protein
MAELQLPERQIGQGETGETPAHTRHGNPRGGPAIDAKSSGNREKGKLVLCATRDVQRFKNDVGTPTQSLRTRTSKDATAAAEP